MSVDKMCSLSPVSYYLLKGYPNRVYILTNQFLCQRAAVLLFLNLQMADGFHHKPAIIAEHGLWS